MNITDFLPCSSAYDEHLDLDLPLKHLLGNRIAIYLESIPEVNSSRHLVVSTWKPKIENPNQHASFPTGRIHIVPADFTKMILLEDIVISPSDLPKDFPMVYERKTTRDIATIGLYYPKTSEQWEFQIHLAHIPPVKEEKYTLVNEGILHAGFGIGQDWTPGEITVYDKTGFRKSA